MYLKAHCAWGEKCKMWKYHFKNIIHSCIISCVCIAPVQVQNWAKHGGSMLHHVVRRASWRNELNWLPFKKIQVVFTNSCACILGVYVHICKRYEVSVIKPVDRGTIHWWWWCQCWHTTDNSWLCRLFGMTAKIANHRRYTRITECSIAIFTHSID